MAERSEVKAPLGRFYSQMRESFFYKCSNIDMGLYFFWKSSVRHPQPCLVSKMKWLLSKATSTLFFHMRRFAHAGDFIYFLASSALSNFQNLSKRNRLQGSDALWECQSSYFTPEATIGKLLLIVWVLFLVKVVKLLFFFTFWFLKMTKAAQKQNRNEKVTKETFNASSD